MAKKKKVIHQIRHNFKSILKNDKKLVNFLVDFFMVSGNDNFNINCEKCNHEEVCEACIKKWLTSIPDNSDISRYKIAKKRLKELIKSKKKFAYFINYYIYQMYAWKYGFEECEQKNLYCDNCIKKWFKKPYVKGSTFCKMERKDKTAFKKNKNV